MSEFPSKKLVLTLIQSVNNTKTKMQSISGELGEKIKSYVENKNLHAGALKFIAKLARMDEQKRDEFLRHFDAYRAYAHEAAVFGQEHVGDLADQAQADAEDNAAHDEGEESLGNAADAAVASLDQARGTYRKLA